MSRRPKRRVFGTVGIDMIAGPSEVLVIADDSGNADWIAADLLAQAEHDTAAQSILITDSAVLAQAVAAAVERQLASLPRVAIAEASWRDHGAIIEVASLSEALPLADRLAPEHLEIITRDADALARQVRNAGAIFIGGYTPEAIGDYVGGSNHVLPTARSARFSSGLGVLDFMKRTSILKCSSESLAALGPAAIALGKAEGPRRPCSLCRLSARPDELMSTKEPRRNRLLSVTLDEASIGRGTSDQEHERQIAIYDLVEENDFGLPDRDDGPYALKISLHDAKLALEISSESGDVLAAHILSLTPFRSLLKDYFLICESYYDAIRTATRAQIEAIDMGRRGLHDEAATLLQERLKGKIVCDLDTARRIFTLVTALHWKG